MAVGRVNGGPQVSGNQNKDPKVALQEAGNRAVMNKDYEPVDAPPNKVDDRNGVPLNFSKKELFGRVAFNIEGQLYIRDTVMNDRGDMQDIWRRGKKPLQS